MSPPRFFASRQLLALALLTTAATTVSAQPFEEVFGPRDARDQGERRVTAVSICPDPGYIAVGTTNDGINPSRVYLVRTDAAGNMLWERSYDVGNDGRADQGFALAELRTGGYMITGTSDRGSISAAFLLRVDCNGENSTSAFYNPPATSGFRVVGHDIVQARTGNSAVGTAPGDILVAGYVEKPGNTADAFLMRTRLNFAVLWNRRYEFDVNEHLFALTEATPGATVTGDVVAVGDYQNTTGSQGLSLRVSGDNGLIVAAPHCAAAYGDFGAEALHSVVELRNENPNLVMVGFSTTPGLASDLYLLKTRDNPCFLITQSVIGNENGQGYDEVAFDVKEVLEVPDDSTGAVIGDLALTGFAEQDGSRRDAFLLYADVTQLLPLSARVYGDHFDRVDEGHSLAGNYDKGWVIAGYSESDFEANGDPRDLYLINTTNSSKTGCEKEWFPKWDIPGWPERELKPTPITVVSRLVVPTTPKKLETAFINCP